MLDVLPLSCRVLPKSGKMATIDLQLNRFGKNICFKTLLLTNNFAVTQRNNNQQRNSAVPNMVNSIKQVNKVKPNVTRQDNLVSPGYNSR